MPRSFTAHLLELRERLKPAQESLAVNLYRFGQAELEKEDKNGFPVLSLVLSKLSHNYRLMLLNMQPDRREAMLNDAIRWRHRAALKLLGEEVPEQRPAYLEELFESCFRPSEENVNRYGYLQPWVRPTSKISKSRFWRALKPEMVRVTGTAGERIPGGEQWYNTGYGQWTTATYLDTGGTSGIRVAHDIRTHRLLDIARQLSILSILGFPIAASWELAGSGQEESVATCIAMVCDRIIGVLPRLLEGVKHDISPEELAKFAEEDALDSQQRREKSKQSRVQPRGNRGRGAS